QSIASLRGAVAEALVRDLVAQVRHCRQVEHNMRQLLSAAFADLPASPHVQVVTVPGIGEATAAVLVAKTGDIGRFATPEPFDGQHFSWESSADNSMSAMAPSAADMSTPSTSNDKAVGHKRDVPAKQKVVTTAAATVAPGPAPVKPKSPPPRPRCGKVDFTFL